MADPFYGEIRAFAFDFAPLHWAFCQGQLLPISQNTALFSVIGIQFGGNGVSSFALPDLQGMAPMGSGDGPGLTSRTVGEPAGTASETLLPSEMPQHTHAVTVEGANATAAVPQGNFLAKGLVPGARPSPRPTYAAGAATTALAANALAPFTGGGQPHNNMQPYLALNFCICLSGEFPVRG